MSKQSKVKVQIKSFGGAILFEYETKDNSIGTTLGRAVLEGADLRGAYLQDANLQDANLRGAYLRGAKNVPNLYKTSLYLLKQQPPDTTLRAFKYLNDNKSPYQNYEYTIGATYTAMESDNDETVLCGKGINVATLDWCLRDTGCDLAMTYVEVEFQAKDLIIPYNSDGKFRIKRGGKVKFIRKLTKKELEKATEPINKME